MIARVRIAPVEQWCEGFLCHADRSREKRTLPGLEIFIRTETMADWDYCAGRAWQVTPEAHSLIRATAGVPPDDDREGWICEHLLEMD
jgi:hypothetical protein